MADYTLADALALMQSMEADAERDCAMMEHQGNEKMTTWWESWAAALWTLRHHIETGVKKECFPVGNCQCHPFHIAEKKEKQMKARSNGLSRARVLLLLVKDGAMSERGAESLVAEADEYPGEWRRFSNIRVRRTGETFSLEIT